MRIWFRKDGGAENESNQVVILAINLRLRNRCTETTLLLALACIAAGLLVEDIGSRIESRFLDKRLGTQPGFSTHSDEWNQYLRLVFKAEPVGQRYLRAILLRFKFELGTAIALFS